MVAGVHDAKPRAAAAISNNATEKDIPTETEMGDLFEAAMRQQQIAQKAGAEPKVTSDEQHKFLSAMKNPEFRSLLNEYMQEISDPRNRAETEQYLSQLESDQKVPADKQLVKPTPGFVVKTKWESKQKIFVNICSSDKMQPPSSTKVVTGQQGTSWNLPYSLGPERLETDKGGSGVPTFDVCFHPRVLEFAMARVDYRDMVISTCLDAVEPILRESRRKPNALLVRSYHILKGVFYKSGEPVTMCIRKERDAFEPVKPKKETTVQAVKTASKDKITVLGDKKHLEGQSDESVLNELTHLEQTEPNLTLMKEVSSVKLESKLTSDKPKQKKMEHQLIYRGRFELLHHMQADPDKKVPEDRYRPKELVVEVSFPLSSSAKGLDLDVSERMLRLSASSSVSGNYEPLEVVLPFPVIEDKGSAKFDRKTHKLVVTLPVQPPVKPKPQSVSVIVQDDDEEEEETAETEPKVPENSGVRVGKPKKEGEDEFRMLRETALMVANDPQVLAHTARSQSQPPALARPLVTEPTAIKDEIYDDLPPLETSSDEDDDIETEVATIEAEPSSSVPTAIETPSETTTVIKPPFETVDTPTCVSYIIGVAGIDSTSVKLTFPSSSLRLQFSDMKKRVYELQINVLPVDIVPSTAEFDVASENMVVIFQKKTAASRTESSQNAVQHDVPAPVAPVAAARFQNQLLYELD